MAWRCSGATNQELLSNMRSAGLVHSPLVAQAMAQVDRACYVPVARQREAYVDAPQPIGFGATISAPHMHAHAVEALLPYLHKGAKVLDLGSGSGYTMAIFWHLVKQDNAGAADAGILGQVTGVDHIPQLVDMARQNLRRDGLGEALDKGWVDIVAGDGRLGYPPRGPYAAIHVGAASKGIPEALIAQLDSPGRMFIPVEDAAGYGQDIWHVDKDKEGKVTKEKQFGVMYVPLTDAKAQWPDAEPSKDEL